MIRVQLRDHSYSILLEESFAQLPRRLASLRLSPYGWVISHQHLLHRYGKGLLGPLRRAGWTLHTLSIPAAESSKSLRSVELIIAQLARQATMRTPVLLAFGGGVVGDVTGFVAAMFRRGVPYIQVPTTLLAQVDSAVGGKVGVDLPQAKNFIGAFYQPRLVYNNLRLLRTLPLRQRQSGLAEVIKYGAIADQTLFRFLETHLTQCLKLEADALHRMVERSCQIKARYVSQDERETTGRRAELNFGHTLGHALEAATHYQRWTHGEAIAIGMCAAADLSATLGMCTARDRDRLIDLIRSAGLPTRASGVNQEKVFSALRYDKKFIGGRPRWVMLKRLGGVVVTESVPEALARHVLRQYLG